MKREASLSNAISGILPIKNGETWIERNLPKILANLNQEDELIVIDDHSTDSTFAKINKFSEHDSRIMPIKSELPGLVNALNQAASIASNPWMARFDIDDSYPKNRISLQRALLHDNSVGVIFADYEIWLEERRFAGTIYSPVFPIQCKVSLAQSRRTAHPVSIINREKFHIVGGYRAEDFPAEDLGLWIRLSKVSTLLSVPEVGLRYNLRVGSVSSQLRSAASMKKTELIQSLSFSEGEISMIKEYLSLPLLGYDSNKDGIVRAWLFLNELRTLNSTMHKKLISNRLIRFARFRLLRNSFNFELLKQIYYVLLRRTFRVYSKVKLHH